MNDHQPLSESTESALRAPLPDADPRPGFETRLLANIQGAPEPKSRHLASQWLLAGLGTAVLVATLAATLLRPEPPTDLPPVARKEPKPIHVVNNLPNPLEDEFAAVSHSANRVGKFLISHLPSLPEPDEEAL